MRLNRIYQNCDLSVNQTIALDKAASLHLSKVLRSKIGDILQLFNGNGFRYQAKISQIDRNTVVVLIDSEEKIASESPLNIHLYQGVSRGDKMDLTIQKSVELGVNSFSPIITERCGVKLDPKRWAKKLEHWEKVIISACEQSGRDILPKINPVQQWSEALNKLNKNSYFLDPHSNNSFKDLTPSEHADEIQLWVGPEGGFSDSEITQIRSSGIEPVLLGPRILRTETAALAAVSSMNALWGDF